MSYDPEENLCSCRSGKQRRGAVDGHGCFLFFHCDECWHEKRAKYRDDIFTRYQSDEPIEPEE
jgi:hypothetical protein